MIIKSMARKEPSFRDLFDYMHKEKNRGSLVVVRNLLVNEGDRDAVVKSFEENAKYLKKRKNGNYLYHEIISINRVDSLSLKKQEKILVDLANRYLEKRASNLLAYGVVHYDTDYLHIHLMISANELYSSKRFRLSKKEFSSIQKELEAYKLEKYPDLGDRKLYNQEIKKEKKRVSQKEYELVKRGGKSRKQEIFNLLKELFSNAKDEEFLKENLEKMGLKIYKRGKNFGIEDVENKKKYRLKSLGLLDEYLKLLDSFEKQKSRENFREIDVKKSIDRTLKMSQKEIERLKELEKIREKKEDKELDLERKIRKWLTNRKEFIKEAIEYFILHSETFEEFESYLKEIDFSFYRVWNLSWVKRVSTGKKYTFLSLWLDAFFKDKFSVVGVRNRVKKRVERVVCMDEKVFIREKELKKSWYI